MATRILVCAALLLAMVNIGNTNSLEQTDIPSIRQAMLNYYAAFPRDSSDAAAYIGEPQVIFQGENVVILATRADIADRLEKLLTQLKARGYSTTSQPELHIRLLSASTALCGAVAVRLKADGTELERSGLTYLLQKQAGQWKIRATVPTDLDKVVE